MAGTGTRGCYAIQVGEDWCEKVVWQLDKQCDAPWQWKEVLKSCNLTLQLLNSLKIG
ncbi:hypothetical protein UY3_05778 [Chelonia mydas]|uniref:Uncharacterized protein n=1 Tax=Chelonia mydas TaxID=8469 RepID=M7C8R6_CHEMY|nr:hypothetical protein UY3_05778 [Chelonia mydas]